MKKALLCLALLAGCVTNVHSGRRQSLAIDEASELQLGTEGCQEALARSAISADPAELDPVVRVGKRLSAVANKPGYRWEFHVIVDDDSLNAWCLPGGKIALTTGVFRTARVDADLAFVLGHVVSHALLRHGGERITRQFREEEIPGLTAASLGDRDPEKHKRVLGCFGVGAGLGAPLPYDREIEAEADRLGLDLMARAGHDPRKAVDVWKRLEQAGGGHAAEFLSTHPSHPTRVKDLESRMPTAMALYDQAIKAPSGALPKVEGRKGKGGPPLASPPGSIVANPAGFLRTKTKDNRHALLFEFWINQDVYVESVRVDGPDGPAAPIEAKAGIPANAKKQALIVRPDTGSPDFPGGRYALALSGSAGGRSFTASCTFEVR